MAPDAAPASGWLGISAVPPAEAVAYLKSKVPVTKDTFKRLDERSKARAFYVAGLARADMVGAVQESLVKALESGQPLESWKRDIIDQFEKNGWAPLNPRHLETIARTNLQAAYQAGRYAQMWRNKRYFPFWMYDAVNDLRTRPVHKALDGKVLSAEDPFWDEWYPPNGFNCRCGVIALTEGQVKRRGLTVEKTPREVETEQGLTTLIPEPGFGSNVGKDWLSGLSPEPIDAPAASMPLAGLARRICREGKAFAQGAPCAPPPLATLDKRHIRPFSAADILPKGLAPEAYVKAFLGEFGLKQLDETKVITVKGGEPVVIGKGFFIDKRGGGWKVAKEGREPFVRLLARTILDPYEVWRVPTAVTGQNFPELRLIRLFQGAGRQLGGFCVFSLYRGRFWSATTAYTPKTGKAVYSEVEMLQYLEDKRAGTLLYREP